MNRRKVKQIMHSKQLSDIILIALACVIIVVFLWNYQEM